MSNSPSPDPEEPGASPAAGPSLPASDLAEEQSASEIAQLKRRLRETTEQYGTAAEEQKAASEELQVINEELRSSAEELEASRAKLQSLNQELTTVNQELNRNVDDLRRANADLANLMAANGVATLFVDRHLAITRYTPSAVELFHLIPTDLGRPLTDLSHQLEYPELAEDARQVLASLVPVKREVTDGARSFLAHFQPYRTSEDRIGGVVLTFTDVTQARQAMKALEASEQRLRTLADAVPQIIWSNDASGRANYFNERWYEYTGLSYEQSYGLGWEAVVHPEDEIVSKNVWEEAQKTGEVFDTEYRLRRADGIYRWFIGRNVPIFDAGGNVTGWFGTATDIQDLKEASAALRASEERLRLIVENAREYAIFSLDLERRITSWNSGAGAILRYTAQEAIGRSGDIIFTAEDIAQGGPAKEAQVALTEGRASDERWHVRKDGSRFWGSGVMMAMHDAHGQAIGFVKIFRDHTEQLLAKEALERGREELWRALNEADLARAEAESAGKAKDHFLAVLSHELRTPLTPVMMATQTLVRRKDLPESVRAALTMIRRNIQLEARFVDELLDITKIERGKLELDLAPVDLHEAIRHAVEICQPDIGEKQQRLEVALEANEHHLMGDFPRLQQVVWNLLKNASKFTPSGGSVTIRTHNAGGQVILQIADTGIGISSEALARIFDPFTQADKAITREYGGLGLGLAIARASVSGHGGEIRVESRGAGHGATFIVSLPLTAGVK